MQNIVFIAKIEKELLHVCNSVATCNRFMNLFHFNAIVLAFSEAKIPQLKMLFTF